MQRTRFVLALAGVSAMAGASYLVYHHRSTKPVATQAQQDVNYTDSLLHVRVRPKPDGSRDVRLTNTYGGLNEVRSLSVPQGIDQVDEGDLSVRFRSEWDSVVVRWGKIRADAHRLDLEQARRHWAELCARAGQGRAAFESGFDAGKLQAPVFVWWALTEGLKASRFQGLRIHMGHLGLDISCPALEELWSAAERRLAVAEAEGCGSDGRLTRDGDHCIAASDEDCLVSRACTYEGRCVARSGECVASSVEHCRRSVACRHQGLCSLDHGRCVADDHDCARSYLCMQAGNCQLDAETRRCSPASQADCERSLRCATRGECELSGTTCVGRRDAGSEKLDRPSKTDGDQRKTTGSDQKYHPT